jgi:hypothetical protein
MTRAVPLGCGARENDGAHTGIIQKYGNSQIIFISVVSASGNEIDAIISAE